MSHYCEEQVAQELESKGYIVIRTYKRGCPDLIAFMPAVATSVEAIEVKGQGDVPRKEQIETVNTLKEKGVIASFVYLEDSPKNNRVILSQVEIEQETKDAFELGRKAHGEGISKSDWPRHPRKYSAAYYRLKSNWLEGWNAARQESLNRL